MTKQVIIDGSHRFRAPAPRRAPGARRVVPSAVARRNAWVLRILGLSVGGLAVGVAIGLVVGR